MKRVKKMTKDKKTILVLGLSLAVLILGGLFAYLYLIKPSLNGLIILGRNEGYGIGVVDSVISLWNQAITCQPVPITLGNQTIDMIAVGCLPEACFTG